MMHQFIMILSRFLQHVYVAQPGLTRRLAVDLLDKMNNPHNHQQYSEVDDDDLEVMSDSVASRKKHRERFAIALTN